MPSVRAGSGADVFVLRLAQALQKAGHEPLLQWFDHRYELMPELMRLHSRPGRVDIIHAGSWNASVFLGLGVPVVTTVLHLVHDPAYAPYRSRAQALYHRWYVRWREERAIKRSAAVTAISSYVGRTVYEAFGRIPIEIIENWVDTEIYKPSIEYRLPYDRPFRLLMVGNHSRRKGFDLLPALAAALGSAFDLRCTGGLRASHNPMWLPNVSMLGHLSEEELTHEYKYCDAVISLSRYEGFGYTALEGMACGKPLGGFYTSGLTDVVAEGVTGFLVPINDVDALTGCCANLLKAPLVLERMGVAARKRATEIFSEKEAVDTYVDVYRKAIRAAS